MSKSAVRGRIIDGTGKEAFSGVIIIEDGSIKEVLAGSDANIPDDIETVIDAGAGTILPGLIDAHMHFIGARSMDITQWVIQPEALRGIRCVNDCQTLLEAGFTTVRDAGGLGIYVRQAIEEGEIRGPRVYSPNKGLSQTAGHGDVHFIPVDMLKGRGIGRVCDGADECRKAAREQFREGADFIKIMSTGGVLSEKDSPDSSQFTMDELAAIVEEADRVGSYVASHAQGTAGIINALKAGIKTIEHGVYMNDEAIDLMLQNDAVMVPTLSIVNRLVTIGAQHGVPEYGLRKAREVYDAHMNSVRMAKAAGVKIATGTDFCGGGFVPHGSNAEELEHLVEVGFTPMEAIMAATKFGGEALQVPDKLGTLEAGKWADLIIVDGDPLTDISAVKGADKVKFVMKDGRIEKNAL